MNIPSSVNNRYAHAEAFARSQNLLDENETFAEAFARVGRVIIDEVEEGFGTPVDKIRDFTGRYVDAIANGDIALGTPVLINAGRPGRETKPLTSCISPPRNVLEGELRADLVTDLYDTEMGMAINLDHVDGDPAEVVEWLDEQARQAADRGKKRACNMVTMSANHPSILEFIGIKKNADPLRSKSNISVMIDDRFMQALAEDAEYPLDLRNNGDIKMVKASVIFDEILDCAYGNGDPGFIFKDRLEEDDPTPSLTDYIALAPCGELGLAPGEACQFSYINLASIVRDDRTIDYEKLRGLVDLIVRMLDNALEYSKARYPGEESVSINSKKRKIGVGILGLADMLIELELPYGSEEAFEATKDVMSFIKFHSKKASLALAKERGQFPAFPISRYATDEKFMIKRFETEQDTTITMEDWRELMDEVSEHGLRNAATVAAPPTGRSSQIIENATPSVEPLWSCLVDLPDDTEDSNAITIVIDGHPKKFKLNPRLEKAFEDHGVKVDEEMISLIAENKGSIGNIESIPSAIRRVFVTSADLALEEHIFAVAAVQLYIDEAVSKTVNLPNAATRRVIGKIYQQAWAAGLKGITVFRDGCLGEDLQVKVIASPSARVRPGLAVLPRPNTKPIRPRL